MDVDRHQPCANPFEELVPLRKFRRDPGLVIAVSLRVIPTQELKIVAGGLREAVVASVSDRDAARIWHFEKLLSHVRDVCEHA